MSHLLHVERHGAVLTGTPAGLPLVMVHGWGMNLRVFDRVRADLAGCESWAIDLPGHGQSPWWSGAVKFDVQRDAVLAALPPRCVLLGWSFGAKIAMALAARQPQRIAALVLVSATPKFTRAADWPHGMDEDTLRSFRATLEQDWQQTLRDFIVLQVRGTDGAAAAGQALEAALASQGAPHRDAMLAGMELLGSVDLREAAPGIRQPTLLIAGRNDRITLPGASRWLAGTMPYARLLEVPRAGHAPFVSHHAAIATATRDFLTGLPAEAAA